MLYNCIIAGGGEGGNGTTHAQRTHRCSGPDTSLADERHKSAATHGAAPCPHQAPSAPSVGGAQRDAVDEARSAGGARSRASKSACTSWSSVMSVPRVCLVSTLAASRTAGRELALSGHAASHATKPLKTL